MCLFSSALHVLLESIRYGTFPLHDTSSNRLDSTLLAFGTRCSFSTADIVPLNVAGRQSDKRRHFMNTMVQIHVLLLAKYVVMRLSLTVPLSFLYLSLLSCL